MEPTEYQSTPLSQLLPTMRKSQPLQPYTKQQQQQHQFNDGFSTVQQLADALLWRQPCPCQK